MQGANATKPLPRKIIRTVAATFPAQRLGRPVERPGRGGRVMPAPIMINPLALAQAAVRQRMLQRAADMGPPPLAALPEKVRAQPGTQGSGALAIASLPAVGDGDDTLNGVACALMLVGDGIAHDFISSSAVKEELTAR